MEPTHKPIVDYFQGLNTKLNDFPADSFFRQDLDEIYGAFRKGINFPCMAVESPEGDAEESSMNNSVIGRMFAFVVYMNPKAGNFEQQNDMLDQCERIGKKLVSRMRYDARIEDNILHDRFEASSVSWVKVGPVFNEMLYGYRFSGFIKGSESLKVDAADWEDLDLIC